MCKISHILHEKCVSLHYWVSENRAEVDFILQTTKGIVPVEVKSVSRINGKSLSVFYSKFAPELRIRFSMNNLKQDQGFIYIPVFWPTGQTGIWKNDINIYSLFRNDTFFIFGDYNTSFHSDSVEIQDITEINPDWLNALKHK